MTCASFCVASVFTIIHSWFTFSGGLIVISSVTWKVDPSELQRCSPVRLPSVVEGGPLVRLKACCNVAGYSFNDFVKK